MSWHEMVLEVAYDDTATFSDALMEAGALSVVVEDADAGTDAETPLFDEPGIKGNATIWKRSRIIAMYASDQNPAEMVAKACLNCGVSNIPAYQIRPVAQKDWVQLTQSQFDPIHIGKNIWVVPSWHAAPDPNAIILEIDPGMAFGTGSHPTTQLCMEWLEACMPASDTLLDYGCGSGILAMTASKLGAALTDGVDIDPNALIAAHENAVRNGCIIDFYLPEAFDQKKSAEKYRTVVANILSGALQSLKPVLLAHLATEGYLVLSGILSWQAEEVIASYAPEIRLSVWKEHDGWVVLTGQLQTH